METQYYNIFTEELYHQAICEAAPVISKDILIIVHDQLDHMRKCVESIYSCTQAFTLYIWDNASQKPMQDYLDELSKSKNNVVILRHEQNIGFIIPNNRLAEIGSSEFLILLNSDVEVFQGWDTALIGWLKAHPEDALTGYLGGLLEQDGKGGKCWSGSWVDYICGWCMCLSRDIYNRFGLFDEVNLKFAYGEDADLSLRLNEAGYGAHALHLGLVAHYGNATIKQVHEGGEMDVATSFRLNHEYMRRRWAHYLDSKRVLLKNSE